MTIIEFCEKYKKASSDKAREQMVRSHIKRTYCPMIEKGTILGLMLDSSIATSESGIKYINMMTSRINYTLAMVALYTDLTIDADENRKGRNFDCYDALVESDAISTICGIIGEREIKEFSSINGTLINNFEKSEGSLEAYVARTITDLKQKVSDIADLMSNPQQLAGLIETLGSLGDGLNG